MRNLLLLLAFVVTVVLLARALARVLRRPPRPVPSGPVPGWASFFSAEAFDRFIAEVRAYFDRKHMHIAISDGLLLCEHILEGRMGLVNIAQLCHRHAPEEWARVIAGHFDSLQEAREDERRLQEQIGDFTAIAPRLALRIMPRSCLDELGEGKLVYRVDLEDTISALVFDLPQSVRSVLPNEAQAWDRPEPDLFAVALRNVARGPAPAFSEQKIAPGVTIRFAVGDSHFTSTHALLLDAHPGWVGPHGALVGIPHRHAVLCLPIADRSAVKALQVLIPTIAGMHREGPGSVSPHLYWYRNGAFVRLPFAIRNQTVDFTPPDDFVEMINGLAEPGTEKGKDPHGDVQAL